jgi:hypothetical protein
MRARAQPGGPWARAGLSSICASGSRALGGGRASRMRRQRLADERAFAAIRGAPQLEVRTSARWAAQLYAQLPARHTTISARAHGCNSAAAPSSRCTQPLPRVQSALRNVTDEHTRAASRARAVLRAHSTAPPLAPTGAERDASTGTRCGGSLQPGSPSLLCEFDRRLSNPRAGALPRSHVRGLPVARWHCQVEGIAVVPTCCRPTSAPHVMREVRFPLKQLQQHLFCRSA